MSGLGRMSITSASVMTDLVRLVRYQFLTDLGVLLILDTADRSGIIGNNVGGIALTSCNNNVWVNILVSGGNEIIVSVNDTRRFHAFRPMHSFDWERATFYLADPEFPGNVTVWVRGALERQKPNYC